jgi:hypothetical protein
MASDEGRNTNIPHTDRSDIVMPEGTRRQEARWASRLTERKNVLGEKGQRRGGLLLEADKARLR